SFRVHATDINVDRLILSALNVPLNATFTDSANGSGSFRFSPSYSQSGVYNVTFIARDTVGAADSEIVAITVTNVNNPPVLDPIGAKKVKEGQILTFRVHATDINGDRLVLSALNVPTNAVFTDSGNGAGSFRFSPNYNQAGIYNVTFIARDTVGAADSELVRITVSDVKRPHVLSSISPKSVIEGQVLTLRIHATNINGGRMILSALNVPVNATFTDSTNGAGSFTFSPNYAQAGIYNVTFIARDTVGAADSELVSITVNNVNLAPLVDSIGPKTMDEGTILVFRVHATDADAESLRLTATSLPLNSIFTDSGNGASSFYFSPSCSQAGIYNVTFKATDPYLASDSEIVHIRVRPPANLIAGDPNGDLFVTVSDVVYIINYLFKSGPPPLHCPRSGDVNCDGKVTVSDAVYLINYLFKGGPPLCQ
ncbi:MAG: tandem-95 repeat protein, partial [candidate division Zixibacteria bacterium]|nr:tandem-95 repeat protein [candidate division Zixibacteria bacterium]